MDADGGDQDDCEYVCLICLEVIANKHPIWNCCSCYCMFHLQCIQSWSSESIANRKQAQQSSVLSTAHFPEVTSKQLKWSCPKCRAEYESAQRPTVYLCFCGKLQDPPLSGWLAPHSCGEPCGRVRDCGHVCTQSCHSGPCTLCAVTVQTTCHCGRLKQSRRCATRAFACGQRCARVRKCGHECDIACHSGECPACEIQLTRACECGDQQRKVVCSEASWRCERECGRKLACGKHVCERGCHAGDCGPCPEAGERTCPCGKRRYAALACDQPAPRCDDTCNRLLACGLHRCVDQCHFGACPACRETVLKRCRCGARQREQICSSAEFTCDTRCNRMRDCGRHVCKRKCCLSNTACPPCDQPCGRQLMCGVHKCASRCHNGPCYPCTQTYELACTCGRTRVLLPCGRESKRTLSANATGKKTANSTNFLHCKYPCNKPSDCHHPQRSPHACHAGDCPPCSQVCGKMGPCKHRCKAACHSAVLTKIVQEKQRVGPWEKPAEVSYKLVDQPCPPCREPVIVKCRGLHETTLRDCSDSSAYSCGRACGRNLACGNHTCEKQCHEAELECAECQSACQKPRPQACLHPCKRGACHPGNCPPCNEFLRIKCHCQLVTLHPRCSDWCSSTQDREMLQSCKDRCPKLMPCGHRCLRNCHSGACTSPEECNQRVTLRCRCKRVKKTLICHDVQLNDRTLPCADNCAQSTQLADAEVDADVGVADQTPDSVAGEQKVRRRRKTDKEAERLAKQEACKREARKKRAISCLKMFAPLIVIFLLLAAYALLVTER